MTTQSSVDMSAARAASVQSTKSMNLNSRFLDAPTAMSGSAESSEQAQEGNGLYSEEAEADSHWEYHGQLAVF